MEVVIAKLLEDFEQGKMSRRQLIKSLSVAAAAAAGMAPAARAALARVTAEYSPAAFSGYVIAVPRSAVVDLPPIVTHLGAPQDTWVRLESSIVFDPKTLPHPETVASQIGDDILAYLRTISLHQLEGSIGLENIRQDLNERAATRSGGKVHALVIKTLVVQ